MPEAEICKTRCARSSFTIFSVTRTPVVWTINFTSPMTKSSVRCIPATPVFIPDHISKANRAVDRSRQRIVRPPGAQLSHTNCAAIIGFGLLQGFGLIVAGSKPSLWVIAFGLAIAAACWQVVSTSIRVLWQTRIPAPLQGRSFAALMLVLQVTAPLAYLVVGPLADNIFEPLLSSGGLLSDNVGHLIGVGS